MANDVNINSKEGGYKFSKSSVRQLMLDDMAQCLITKKSYRVLIELPLYANRFQVPCRSATTIENLCDARLG